MTDMQAYTVAGGILGGMLATVIIFGIAFYVLMIIAEWKIFEKAGEAGWKSLIPIYNGYIMFKIVGMKTWFWILLAVSLGVSIISGIWTDAGQVLAVIEAIFTIVVAIMYIVRLAKSFGKGAGYIVGLILLPNIFTLILGFGSAKYEKIYND